MVNVFNDLSEDSIKLIDEYYPRPLIHDELMKI